MLTELDHRRILLISAEPRSTRALLDLSDFRSWEIVAAESSAAAALLLQNNACDIILADDSHFRLEGIEGLAWLVTKQDIPVVLLADARPETITSAYARGLTLWLPLRQCQLVPDLLTGALLRTVRWNDLQQRQRRTRELLDHCQRQVDRLVALLWRTAPMTVEKRWYTHRHMLERLEEELARAERYQLPLTIALGEVQFEPKDDSGRAETELLGWTSDEVARRKRRGDVAGQYGLRGFMLLMTHTHAEGGVTCCRRIQYHLEQCPAERLARAQPLRACFGVATLSSQVNSSQGLLRAAEEHLEAAKNGQNEGLVAC